MFLLFPITFLIMVWIFWTSRTLDVLPGGSWRMIVVSLVSLLASRGQYNTAHCVGWSLDGTSEDHLFLKLKLYCYSMHRLFVCVAFTQVQVSHRRLRCCASYGRYLGQQWVTQQLRAENQNLSCFTLSSMCLHCATPEIQFEDLAGLMSHCSSLCVWKYNKYVVVHT